MMLQGLAQLATRGSVLKDIKQLRKHSLCTIQASCEEQNIVFCERVYVEEHKEQSMTSCIEQI